MKQFSNMTSHKHSPGHGIHYSIPIVIRTLKLFCKDVCGVICITYFAQYCKTQYYISICQVINIEILFCKYSFIEILFCKYSLLHCKCVTSVPHVHNLSQPHVAIFRQSVAFVVPMLHPARFLSSRFLPAGALQKYFRIRFPSSRHSTPVGFPSSEVSLPSLIYF